MKKENIHRASFIKFEIDAINRLLRGELIIGMPSVFNPKIFLEYSKEDKEEALRNADYTYRFPRNKEQLSGTQNYDIDFDSLVKDAIEQLGQVIMDKIRADIEKVVLPKKAELEMELDELLNE